MSAAERKAALQEALDLSHFFRVNAAAGRHLPIIPPRNVIGDEPVLRVVHADADAKTDARNSTDSKTETNAATSSTSASSERPAAENAKPGLPGWVKTAAVVAGTAAAGLGGAAAYNAITDKPEQPAASSGAGDAAAVDSGGDLIRYLHREGYDLPPGR